MVNNRAGAVYHRYLIKQERIDDYLDRQGVPEQIQLPKPTSVKPDGSRVWCFGGRIQARRRD